MKIRGEKGIRELYQNIDDLKNDFRNKNLNNLIIRKLKEGFVLDVGCGNGILINQLNNKNHTAEGLEPDDKMVEMASKNNPGIPIFQGYAEEMDMIIFNRYDNIVMLDVLEHIKDDVKQVEIMRDLLKKEGRLVFVVPAYPSFYGIRDKKLGHYRRYNKDMILELSLKTNMKVVSCRYWNMMGVFPYLISEKILKKPLEVKKLRSKRTFGSIFLDYWFAIAENYINLGFGLSLIVVMENESE